MLLEIEPVILAAIITAIGTIVAALLAAGKLKISIPKKIRKNWHLLLAVIFGLILGFLSHLGLSKIYWERNAIRIIHTPFEVNSYFYPSGFMGDGELGSTYIKFLANSSEQFLPGDGDKVSMKIAYQPGPIGWGGVSWQYPENNWGDNPGTKIEQATKIIFWARGETGAETIEFKVGGTPAIENYYQDSFSLNEKITLKDDWKKYEIDLSHANLSHVLGAFAWAATKDDNPQGVTFYLDKIYYQ